MRALLVLVLLCVHAVILAQQPAYFPFADKQFEGTDIYSVIQDNQGDYWFATDEGLFRHDGYAFFRIEHEEMNTVSLFNFVRDSEGTIYCNNLNHQIFQIKNGKCSLFFETADTGNDISLLVTPDDDLLISTGRHVYLLDKKHKLLHQYDSRKAYISLPYKSPEGVIVVHLSGSSKLITLNRSKRTLEDHPIDNALLLASFRFFRLQEKSYAIDLETGDIYRFNPKNFEFSFFTNIPQYTIQIALRIYQIDGEVWIASSTGGIQRYKSEDDLLRPQPILFKDELISHAFMDREGNVLLSTFDHGIFVVPNLKSDDIIAALSVLDVTRLEPGVNGKMFLGTRSGDIIAYGESLETILPPGIKAIEAICNPPGSPYLFSDYYGLSIYQLNGGDISVANLGSFKDVVQTGEDEFILALNRGVMRVKIDGATRQGKVIETLYLGRAYAVGLEEKSRYLYISTREGVLVGKEKSGKFYPLMSGGDAVNAVCIQSFDDCTFISTRKKGLLCIQKGKIVRRLKPKLAGEELVITQFIYHQKHFYANTNKGFVILDQRGTVKHLLNKAAGLSTNKIIDFCIQDDALWVVHSRGVQKFPLHSIGSAEFRPGIRFRALMVNDTKQRIQAGMHYFDSDQRKFRFVLQVPTLRHRDNTFYHFRLVGLDSNWHIQTYDNNEIVYNALAPGTYRLEVKAENNGNFSEPLFYAFEISAPFYVRWWFISGCLLLFVLLVLYIYRRQLAIQQKKAAQINELNASRLTAIQSQMNPHFIFNSLNSIQDLVLKGDVDNSYTFITKFSNLVRRTLNYSDKDFIEFEQEIKLIELYLSLEKLRFKEDLSYTLETNGIEDVLLPPMLIQPFIENALVHGLLHKEGPKKLSIRFQLVEESLICEIEDNGVGRKRAEEIKERQRGEHESFAVGAIKRRFSILQQHFGGALGFSYMDLEEGTCVRITLPIRRSF